MSAKKLVAVKYGGPRGLRDISHVTWKDDQGEGEWTVAQALRRVKEGEIIYVPGPLGMAVLSACDYPDGYEGISSVLIRDLPQDVLMKLGLQ